MLLLQPDNTVARKLIQSVGKQKALVFEKEQRHKLVHERVSRGRQMLGSGLFTDAIEAFKSAQQLDPKNPEIKSLLGEALTKKERVGKGPEIDPDATQLVDQSSKEFVPLADETKVIAPPPAETHVLQQKTPERARPPKHAPARKPVHSRRWIPFVAGFVVVAVCFTAYRLFIYTPSPPMGYVALNVVPWAEVTKIQRKDGGEIHLNGKTFTPCRLSLPAGEYTIHLANPDFEQPMSLSISVQEGAVQDINRTMAGFDYMKVVSAF